ncbi:MAG: glycosyltransferase [Planctomycetia bacterium]|nr:glycosyltransferase [Planctomycetia bacterium]
MSEIVSAIVLSRDFDALLAICLQRFGESARRAGLAARCVVIDNASQTPCPETLPGAPPYRLVRFDRHHGFGTACNHGARRDDGDFLLFLNNDVLLDPDALAAMREEFAARPTLAACGTRMVFPDRTIQHAGVVFGAGDVGPYHIHRKRPASLVPRSERRFQAVTGACLMIRRDVFLGSGGFDERYPFGLEDVDLCLRLGRDVGEIVCNQETESLHFESMTPGRVELDPPSRSFFMSQWKGRYAIDG